MSLELLYSDTKTSIGVLTLDASLSEEHTSEATVTEHPVEQGADVADHKRVQPARIKITGIVSNTPLELFTFANADPDRAVTAWGLLRELQAGSELITVVTSLADYPNMVIESLTVPRDAERGNVLEFTAVLREIVTAKTETVEAPPDSPAAPAVKMGKQPTPEAKPAVRESALSKFRKAGVRYVKGLLP